MTIDFEIGGKGREGGAGASRPIPVVHYAREGDEHDPNNDTLSAPGLGPGNSIDIGQQNGGQERVHNGAAYGAVANHQEIEMQMIHQHKYSRSVSDLGAKASQKGAFAAEMMSMGAAGDALSDDIINAMNNDEMKETPGGDLDIDLNEDDIYDVNANDPAVHQDVDDIENVKDMEPRNMRTDDGMLDKMLQDEPLMNDLEEGDGGQNGENELVPEHVAKQKSHADLVDEEVMLEMGKETPNPDMIDVDINGVDITQINRAFSNSDTNYNNNNNDKKNDNKNDNDKENDKEYVDTDSGTDDLLIDDFEIDTIQ